MDASKVISSQQSAASMSSTCSTAFGAAPVELSQLGEKLSQQMSQQMDVMRTSLHQSMTESMAAMFSNFLSQLGLPTPSPAPPVPPSCPQVIYTYEPVVLYFNYLC